MYGLMVFANALEQVSVVRSQENRAELQADDRWALEIQTKLKLGCFPI